MVVAKKIDQNDVLSSMDEAPTSLFHLKTIVIAGMGFFTDSYDLFSIGLLSKLIGRVYYNGATPINITAAITGVALCGTLAGQLFFGWAGDRFGRKGVYAFTLMLMIFSSIASALSFGRTPHSVITGLCFWRFWLGFGVGGDYPLSATIMSEYSSRSNRGAFVAAVFAMQGMGILVAAIVTLIFADAFRRWAPENAENADYVWRAVLLFAALPTALTLYTRAMMPETPRYTMLVKGDNTQAAKDISNVLGHQVTASATSSRRSALTGKQLWANFKWKLFGCASTWFFLDIAFYSQGLFQSDIFKTIGWVPSNDVIWPAVNSFFQPPLISPAKVCSTAHWYENGARVYGTYDCDPAFHGCKSSDAQACWMSPLDETYKIARAQAIIALLSTIPGYWMTVATIECMGRWKIQMMGFFFMTVFMAVLAADYDNLLNHIGGFVTLYALTFFFANWGPNSTTFVVPAEVFPSSWRTTCHGFCAACGKAGAIVGAFGFLYASKDPSNPKDRALYGDIGIGLQKSLGILCVCNFLGLLCTFFVPETKGRTLEDLCGEDEANATTKAAGMDHDGAPVSGAGVEEKA